MAIPKYNEFMKPILVLLSDNKIYSRRDVCYQMADVFKLSEEEKSELLPSGKEFTYENRIGWALTYLKKAGLISSTGRAHFQITELGHKVNSEKIKIIDKKYLMKFDGFKDFQTPNESIPKGGEKITKGIIKDESPQDTLERAYSEISSTLVEEILQEVINKGASFFEKLVVDLLVAMGYGGSKIDNGRVTGKSGDEGIDGTIKEDKLGFDQICIQAKCWDPSRTISRPELQKFVGALSGQGSSKGVFITTASFTDGAKEYATNQHSCKVVLIDGKSLASLMIEYNIGVSIENTYYIKRIDTDYFDN